MADEADLVVKDNEMIESVAAKLARSTSVDRYNVEVAAVMHFARTGEMPTQHRRSTRPRTT